jgi:hypothetical protein
VGGVPWLGEILTVASAWFFAIHIWHRPITRRVAPLPVTVDLLRRRRGGQRAAARVERLGAARALPACAC